MTPLNADAIKDACMAVANHAPEVVLFETIESTNSWLVEQGGTLPEFTLCCTEQQTAGRGRRGKQWLTPVGGVTFSVQLRVPQPIARLAGFSLLTGAAVCRVLRRHQLADVMVKWPNDIYQQGRKLAGILIETGASEASGTVIVAGIGINYRQGAERSGIDQPNTDLYAALGGTPPDRSALIGQIAAELYLVAMQFDALAMQKLATNWSQYDFLHNQPISIIDAGSVKNGIARGIDNGGRLLVETPNGVTGLSSGEVSVRVDSQV